MKLINVNTKYYLISNIFVLLVWSIAFYYIISNEIEKDVDDFLSHRKEQIVQAISKNPKILRQTSPLQFEYKIDKITTEEAKKLPEGFRDIFVTESVEQQQQPYRRLVSIITVGKSYYKLTIQTSLLKSRELLDVIIITVIGLFSGLLFFAVLINRVIVQRMWRPFFSLLDQVNSYKLEYLQDFDAPPTKISEFKKLNDSITQLIKSNLLSYRLQKQFSEDASHEIQTPLAIIRNKTDLLMQSPNLTEMQADLVQSIGENLDRLSKLNKSLLLLSKIQNNQFAEAEKIDVSSICSDLFEDLNEFMAFKNLTFNLQITNRRMIEMNRDLAEILFSNLARNAILHNIENGWIDIAISKDQIVVTNTGEPFTGDTSLLFQRFNKAAGQKRSCGLGLSIVKTICEYYHFPVSYSVEKNIHKITILFENSVFLQN